MRRTACCYFQAVGREKGRDPYFTHLYRIRHGRRPGPLLTPEDANHDISLSPPAATSSTATRNRMCRRSRCCVTRTDKLIVELEKRGHLEAARRGLEAAGSRSRSKAATASPTCMASCTSRRAWYPAKKYPIVNHIYPGPQTGSVGSRNFSAARGDAQALAELGFVVVEIDGMGTPWRSKKFHEAYYGDMGDNTLPDQIAGMKELAATLSMDRHHRVGIYGHSGGGYAAAAAMFRYPDFFKVGIAESGNHDNRVYEDDWAEKWTGLLEHRGDGFTNYDSQANQNFAKNLKGKLLLAHGTMDNNVPPNNTLLVVDALIKANKDFDLLMIPNAAHGYGNAANYMTRRRWDYFVRNLLGVEPPREYCWDRSTKSEKLEVKSQK